MYELRGHTASCRMLVATGAGHSRFRRNVCKPARCGRPTASTDESLSYIQFVARSYPLEQAGDAHRYLAERRNIGKVVVLTPR